MMPPVGDNTALLLDIDGTLLDLARTPDKVIGAARVAARPANALHSRLGGALAFVSGRSLAGIDRLFAPFRPAAIGAHGGEIRGADGAVTRAASPCGVRCAEIFEGLAANIPGLLLEDKKCAMALHYRLAPEALPVLMSAMESTPRLFEAEKVSHPARQAGDRLASQGRGQGLRRLRCWRSRSPFAGRAIVFGGDDTTDLDVFRILPRLGGHGFSVGRDFPGADIASKSPRAVRAMAGGSWRRRVCDERGPSTLPSSAMAVSPPWSTAMVGWCGGVFPASTAIRYFRA